MAQTTRLDVGSFVSLGKKDRKPSTPRLNWKLEASQRLSLTTSYSILSTIHRAADDDGKGRRCIFHWSMYTNAFAENGCILVRHKDDGTFENVLVDNKTGLVALSEQTIDSLIVSGQHQADLFELGPGEQTSPTRLDLPERYYRVLKAGETYSLVFPGTEIGMWAWGSIQDNVGLEMKAGTLLPSGLRSRPLAKKGQGQPQLIMSGGALLTFTAVAEELVWPERAAREAQVGFVAANTDEERWRMMQQVAARRKAESPAPLAPSDRISPGAPMFSASLRCPPTLRGRGYFDVEIVIKYEGVERGDDQPMTFHWLSLVSDQQPGGFQIYRRRRGDAPGGSSAESGTWESCELEETSAGFMIVDEPDISVRVGQHKHFTSLRPGETWTTTQALSGDDVELPQDMAPGDVFRCTFEEATVDWWDWGTMEDHAETVVKLPCYEAGNVTEPSDNGGRPKLVVSSAKPVEFAIIE
ncbi:hypothetical protein LY78DRAFT_742473 [Colletotrichum sublineola]|nr:hypothetical protein LY78DRAFT_742473 [Colletotrichum sublineola]